MTEFNYLLYQCDEDDEEGAKLFKEKFEEFIWPKLINKEPISNRDLGYLETLFDYDTKIEMKNYGHFSNILVKVRDKYFSYTRTFKHNKVEYTQPVEVVPCEKTVVVRDWRPIN